MGDRANVAIRTNENIDARIFLYAHSAGYGMGERVKCALEQARPRWNDASYGARIFLSSMLTPEEHNAETGFGLSLSIADNDGYDCIEVDFVDNTVRIRKFDSQKWSFDFDNPPIASWLFDEYCKLADVSWDALKQVEA